jgi:hypothetical protein
MWYRKFIFRFLLLFVVILPTLVLMLLKTWFSIDRALFVYEYFLIGFLVAFNFRSLWSWLVFLFVFILDIVTVFSKLYLFNLYDFLNILTYFGNYTINLTQVIILISTVFVLFGVLVSLNFIKRRIGYDKVSLWLFTVMVISIFALDNINGSSVLSIYNSSFNFYNSNFAGSPAVLLYHGLINRNVNTNVPELFPPNKESITFKEYTLDSTSNQMLIIVESFGLINDSLKREAFQKDISAVFEDKNWKTIWGKTEFTGSTTRSELRELLNCVGDYRYFINADHATNFNSIFHVKKKQGYNTIAIHSYKANMFERSIWWNNIGADQVYFSEDMQLVTNFQIKLNNESPFTSVNDEDAFRFIQSKTSVKGKQFVYFLTENSHLPFKGKIDSPISSKFFIIEKEQFLSEEAKSQNKRITNFLNYVAKNLDICKFQKILIVGDHMPPFLNKVDREFYSNKFVPYLIVKRP